MAPAVERLLGLDFDRFTKTVVLPQGRFAQFLHDKAGASARNGLTQPAAFAASMNASTVISRPFTGSMHRPNISRVTAPRSGSESSSQNTTGDMASLPSSRIAGSLDRSRGD